MSDLTVGVWHDPLWNIFNFVAYRGSAHLRISVHAAMTDEQKETARRQAQEQFSEEDVAAIESSFNCAYNNFMVLKTNSDHYSVANDMPGVKERVLHPVTKIEDTLFQNIISLNDVHKWTREQIADWIETLDIDTRFEVKKDEPVKFTS